MGGANFKKVTQVPAVLSGACRPNANEPVSSLNVNASLISILNRINECIRNVKIHLVDKQRRLKIYLSNLESRCSNLNIYLTHNCDQSIYKFVQFVSGIEGQLIAFKGVLHKACQTINSEKKEQLNQLALEISQHIEELKSNYIKAAIEHLKQLAAETYEISETNLEIALNYRLDLVDYSLVGFFNYPIDCEYTEGIRDEFKEALVCANINCQEDIWDINTHVNKAQVIFMFATPKLKQRELGELFHKDKPLTINSILADVNDSEHSYAKRLYLLLTHQESFICAPLKVNLMPESRLGNIIKFNWFSTDYTAQFTSLIGNVCEWLDQKNIGYELENHSNSLNMRVLI